MVFKVSESCALVVAHITTSNRLHLQTDSLTPHWHVSHPLPTLTWFTVTAGGDTGVCCCTAAGGGVAVLLFELVALRGSFLGAVFSLRGLLRGLGGFWCSREGGGNRSLSLTTGLVDENTDRRSIMLWIGISSKARHWTPSYWCLAPSWQTAAKDVSLGLLQKGEGCIQMNKGWRK